MRSDFSSSDSSWSSLADRVPGPTAAVYLAPKMFHCTGVWRRALRWEVGHSKCHARSVILSQGASLPVKPRRCDRAGDPPLPSALPTPLASHSQRATRLGGEVSVLHPDVRASEAAAASADWCHETRKQLGPLVHKAHGVWKETGGGDGERIAGSKTEQG